MKIVRVFAGDDGESHFEEVSFEEMQGMVDRVGPGDINVNRREAPNFSDYHQAPRRQYVVNLEGIAEFECADGSKAQLEAGATSWWPKTCWATATSLALPSPGCAPPWRFHWPNRINEFPSPYGGGLECGHPR